MKTKIFLFIAISAILNIFPIYTQQSIDPVLFKIGQTKITQSEFEHAYRKDLSMDNHSTQDIHQFLESYINLKLNVEEAKSRGYDKSPEFISEYSRYLEQIEQPYIADSTDILNLAREIYQKLQENIEISQIFIQLPDKNILPKDTIDSYNKSLIIKNLITKNKDTKFEYFVNKYSEDNQNIKSSTPGYVGWRTVFSNPFRVDQAMYSTLPGEVSDPIRTEQGYYLIKVNAKRPDPGQIHIAHILFRYSNPNPNKKEIDSLKQVTQSAYSQLQKGADWDSICTKYSADRVTVPKGGSLGWFGIHRPLPQNLEQLLFNINKIDDITPPIEMEYGFHIFKLIDKASPPQWSIIKEPLLKSIPESDYNEMLIKAQIKRLSEKYPYTINQDLYTRLIQTANSYNIADSSYFKQIESSAKTKLLSIGNNEYRLTDFIYFLEQNPENNHHLSTDALFAKMDQYILYRLKEYQKESVLEDVPQLKSLANEFHDGILYFDIMNKEVWEKAQNQKDSIEQIFLNNRNKYQWNSTRFKGLIIHARDKKTAKLAKDFILKNKNETNLQSALELKFNSGDTPMLRIEKGLWKKGENPYIDQLYYKIKLNNEIIGFPEYFTEGKLLNEPETVSDVLGNVISDYQNLLEKQWTNQLRQKYNVEIDKTVLQRIQP